MNALSNLADGFLDALEADFENISQTAFRDRHSAEAPNIELANISDWSGLVSSLPKSPTFPEVPFSEHNFPRPSSRQKMSNSRGGDRENPSGRMVKDSLDKEISNKDGSQQQQQQQYDIKKAPKQKPLPIGWTYRKGWANRPRATSIDNEKLTCEMSQRAQKLQAKRASTKRNNLMGKGKGANFSYPENERLRPKGFGSADLNRLRLIMVDVSASRNPGPRYMVDPQPSRQELSRHRTGKTSILRPNSSVFTGKSKSFGMKLESGSDSSMIGGAPSLESFSRIGMENSQQALESRGAKPTQSLLVQSAMSGPRIDTSGRQQYGSIYYDNMQAGGPGPANYHINEAYLKTSAVISAERATFSPINSRPSSPESRDNSRPTSRSDKRNRGRSRSPSPTI